MPRRLECNTDRAMDSHHSWSSNSRWLLYTSKVNDGIFTKLHLAEINEEGHASPPVELPFLRDTMLCYNVPEFFKFEMEIDADDVITKTSYLKDDLEYQEFLVQRIEDRWQLDLRRNGDAKSFKGARLSDFLDKVDAMSRDLERLASRPGTP